MSKKKLLFVDDDDALRPVVSKELSGKGFEVETADDGDVAIEALKRNRFDIVVLDIKMPRVNGFEVLKFIKAEYPATKVVMLTGHTDLKNALESKKLGADDFIGKPYDLYDLVETLEAVFQH
jgi:DNA-binding NtrC family response regulator